MMHTPVVHWFHKTNRVDGEIARHLLGWMDLLAADIQPLGQRQVALILVAADIRQQAASPADQLEQPAAGRLVFLVGAQVLGELADPGGQKRNLHF